ncbi:ADAMTS-like protein 3, partial [Ophiophagus hannah]
MAYSRPILGYQLNSAECMDIRSKRVVPDQYCHYYPENKKPKPKLKECNMDPCPSRCPSLRKEGIG